MAMYDKFKKFMGEHNSEILTALGIVGYAVAIVTAVKATPKAIKAFEKEEQKLIDEEVITTSDDKVPVKNIIRATWKHYITPVTIFALSTACVLGSTSVNNRKRAAIAAAYSISDTAFREYKNKIVEEIGEKKDRELRNEIKQEKLNENPVSNNTIFVTGKGKTLCYDTLSGRYFESDIDQLKKIENYLNKRMRDEMYISLNDFYYEIGGELRPISIGDDIGWDIDHGYLDLEFDSQLADDGTPCLTVDYNVQPRYRY